MDNDLISRSALKEVFEKDFGQMGDVMMYKEEILAHIENAPTVELFCAYLSDGEVRQPCLEAPCKHERSQDEIFPMKIVAGKCPIDANGDCPLRPQGEWVENHCDYGVYYRCSICHKMPPNYECDYKEGAIKTNFCPNCGAKMQKDVEDK